jgi:CRP-like cAMP-binding protein
MLGALPPAFAGLEPDDAQLAASLLQPLSLSSGETIVEAGEEDFTLAFVSAGSVQLLDGDVRVGAASAGDMLGEVELFLQTPRVCSAVATTPVHLLALAYEHWLELCEAGSSAIVHNIERAAHRRLGERLRWLNVALADRTEGVPFELHPRGKTLLGRLSGLLGGGAKPPAVDPVDVLTQSALFNWAEPEILTEIAQFFEVERFDAEMVLCRQGEVGDKVYVIASGKVDVVVFIGKDSAETIATLGPGEAFGDAALAQQAPRTASCVTHEEVVALTMGRESYGELFALNDANGSVFRQAMLRNLIAQLLPTQARYAELARAEAEHEEENLRGTPINSVWRD